MIRMTNFRTEFIMAGDKMLCNVPCTTGLQSYNILQQENTCHGTEQRAGAQGIWVFVRRGVLWTSGQSFLVIYGGERFKILLGEWKKQR